MILFLDDANGTVIVCLINLQFPAVNDVECALCMGSLALVSDVCRSLRRACIEGSAPVEVSVDFARFLSNSPFPHVVH